MVSGADTPGRSIDNLWSHRHIALVTTLLYRLFIIAAVFFLLFPLLIVVLSSFNPDPHITNLPETLSLTWYRQMPQELGFLGFTQALIMSLKVAVATVVLSTTIGGLAAFAIVRYDYKYSAFLETVLISPLIYPWLVVGLSLLIFVSRLSSVLGIEIPMSFWTVLLGHIIFTVPFPIRSIGASLQNFEYSTEEAARNLGATELETFLHITLPIIKPGIVSGGVLVFILSFNQYIISVFLLPSGSRTVPVLMFSLFRHIDLAMIAGIGTLLMTGILVLVFVTEYFFGMSEYL